MHNAFKYCFLDIAAEFIVRKFFVFIKESIDFELEQDVLIQRDLLDEKEKEDHICKDQCKAFWCERYLKRLIMKKTCEGFIAFIHDRPSLKDISKTISMTKDNPLKSELTETARGNVTAQLVFFLFFFVMHINTIMFIYYYFFQLNLLIH